jgi:hypothetical protein
MKKTAAALLLVAAPALAGAGVLQDTASAGQTHYTKHYVLKEQAGHDIGKLDFAGTDKIMSAGSRDVLGYDAVTGHFYPKQHRAVIFAALALKGGVIDVRVQFHNDSQDFKGRILHGSGRYAGITGTVTGRDARHGRTFLTLDYVL